MSAFVLLVIVTATTTKTRTQVNNITERQQERRLVGRGREELEVVDEENYSYPPRTTMLGCHIPPLPPSPPNSLTNETIRNHTSSTADITPTTTDSTSDSTIITEHGDNETNNNVNPVTTVPSFLHNLWSFVRRDNHEKSVHIGESGSQPVDSEISSLVSLSSISEVGGEAPDEG